MGVYLVFLTSENHINQERCLINIFSFTVMYYMYIQVNVVKTTLH